MDATKAEEKKTNWFSFLWTTWDNNFQYILNVLEFNEDTVEFINVKELKKKHNSITLISFVKDSLLDGLEDDLHPGDPVDSLRLAKDPDIKLHG